MEAVLHQACCDLGLVRSTKPHNPNQDVKARPLWFDLSCRHAQRHMWATARTHGKHSPTARTARSSFRATVRRATRSGATRLPHLLKSRPREAWRLLQPPSHTLEADPAALTAHFH